MGLSLLSNDENCNSFLGLVPLLLFSWFATLSIYYQRHAGENNLNWYVCCVDEADYGTWMILPRCLGLSRASQVGRRQNIRLF